MDDFKEHLNNGAYPIGVAPETELSESRRWEPRKWSDQEQRKTQERTPT